MSLIGVAVSDKSWLEWEGAMILAVVAMEICLLDVGMPGFRSYCLTLQCQILIYLASICFI
jgi:hypothetical protein